MRMLDWLFGGKRRRELAQQYREQGKAAFDEDRYADAIEYFLKVLSLVRDNSTDRCNLAAAYHYAGAYGDAIDECLRALRMNPREWRAHGILGQAYYSQGIYAQAIQHLEQAAALCRIPDALQTTYQNLEAAYSAVGRHQEARLAAKKAAELERGHRA